MNRLQHLHFLRTLADWLDTRFKGPWGIRFGLDPLLGLIPIVGDLVTVFLSIYILFNAYLMGCSFSIFLRMLLNVAIEFVVERIPFIGPIFDFVWKANTKNIQILETHLKDPRKARNQSRWVVIAVIGSLTLFIVFCFVLAYFSLQILFQLISILK